MGKFIENLRRRNNVGAQREVESILSEARKPWLERQRVLQKRAENKLQWDEARTHFEESGLLTVFKEVIELKGAVSYYVDPINFDEMIYYKFDVGHPYFYAELHIEETVKERDDHLVNGGHVDKITTRYISTKTDRDGTISFLGSRLSGHLGRLEAFTDGVFVEVPIVVKVPKTSWEKDKDVLEDSLSRVYRHPRIKVEKKIVGSPYFDRLAEHLKEDFNREYKEPGV